jgi:hypothetical protein
MKEDVFSLTQGLEERLCVVKQYFLYLKYLTFILKEDYYV